MAYKRGDGVQNGHPRKTRQYNKWHWKYIPEDLCGENVKNIKEH